MVEIEDDGPGIPEDIRAKVFDPFFTTKPPGKGTGMGLNISYNIVVQKHRGDIKVFSKPGQTCFRVLLPVNPETAEGRPAAVAAHDMATDEELKEILESVQTIAVVGMSQNKNSAGHTVPAYLQEHGYRVIPVNPKYDEILGEKAYPNLLAIPESVDAVQIFRRSEDVPPVVEQAIKINADVVWMQLEVVNEQAFEMARMAGLKVVMDRCMRSVHKRLFK